MCTKSLYEFKPLSYGGIVEHQYTANYQHVSACFLVEREPTRVQRRRGADGQRDIADIKRDITAMKRDVEAIERDIEDVEWAKRQIERYIKWLKDETEKSEQLIGQRDRLISQLREELVNRRR